MMKYYYFFYKISIKKNIVEECFYGITESKIICKKSNHSSNKCEKHSDIAIAFPPENNYFQRRGIKHNLLDMLKNSFETESFTEKDGYYCEKCNKKNSLAEKYSKLLKVPPYLIITANRFYIDHYRGRRVKILDEVKCCLEFEINELFDNIDISKKKKTGYYLYAIIIHRVFKNLIYFFLYKKFNYIIFKNKGDLERGHYYVIARENDKSSWYLFNDENVQVLQSKSFDINQIITN